jgi:hypothetical protein
MIVELALAREMLATFGEEIGVIMVLKKSNI